MSRHRNVRNMIADDYDDYDDGGGDDYDDYDDGYTGGAASMQAATASAKKKKKKKKAAGAGTAPTAAAAAAAATTTSAATKVPAGTTTAVTTSNSNNKPATTTPAFGTTAATAISPPAGLSTPISLAQLPAAPPGFASMGSRSSTTSGRIISTSSPGPPTATAEAAAVVIEGGGGTTTPNVPVELLWNNNHDPQGGGGPGTHHHNKKKPLLTVVVLGHVDAGKSTITGHLLHLVGRQLQQQQQQNATTTTSTAAVTTTAGGGTTNVNNGSTLSPNTAATRIKPPAANNYYTTTSAITTTTSNNYFAWLLDEDEQERKHGVTMDVATKSLRLPHLDILLLDAPGHADFVPAMITGTANADAAVLVVDVSDYQGEKKKDQDDDDYGVVLSAKGQLKEHVYLAKGLGVNQMLVVLSKMDVVGYDNVVLYRAVERRLRHFLIHGAGYAPHKVRCVPASGLSGVNIILGGNTTNATMTDEERQLRSWYDGPTVVQALDTFDVPPWQQSTAASLERPLRLIVADVVEGSNAISIRAKIVAGWVRQGEKLILLPVGDVVALTKVQSVHNSQSSSATTTTTSNTTTNRTVFGSGELIDATITGLSDAQRIGTGAILARPQQRPPLARRCRARLYVLDNVSVPIIRGATVVFHLHHLDLPCSVAALLYTLEPDGTTVRKHQPRALSKNTSAVVELQLLSANPVCMESFADCRALGRFVLRRGGDSVAVGRIEQVLLG